MWDRQTISACSELCGEPAGICSRASLQGVQERPGDDSRTVPFRQAARSANRTEDATSQPPHTPTAADLGHAALRHTVQEDRGLHGQFRCLGTFWASSENMGFGMGWERGAGSAFFFLGKKRKVDVSKKPQLRFDNTGVFQCVILLCKLLTLFFTIF